MVTARSRLAASILVLAAAAGVLGAPASESKAPIRTELRDPGLALRSGATLAAPKVLALDAETVGVSQVVEDQEGAERREDAGTEVAFALQAEVFFAKDSARMSSSARARIASVVQEMRQRPGTKVQVYGFADYFGSSAHGDVLSRQRGRCRPERAGRGTERRDGRLRHARVRGVAPGGVQRHRGRTPEEPAGRDLILAYTVLTRSVRPRDTLTCAGATSEKTELYIDIRFRM